VALLAAFAGWLAGLDYTVPEQDLTISLRRIPALPRSRFVLTDVRRSGTSPTSGPHSAVAEPIGHRPVGRTHGQD
jgi:fatty-acid peroxygenase